MSKKLTYEFVKESFESEWYILVSKEHINNKTKLNYKCPKEHEHSISWDNWNRGHRCPSCAGKIKLTIEQVRESFNKEGYTLLSKKYINNKTKLNYRCSKGHEHSISWGNWQQENRCLSCSGKIKLTIEQVRESFNKEGYTLLSKKYINNKTKLSYECPKKHEHSIIWNHWQHGYRCPTCYFDSQKLTFNFVKESFEDGGYTLLSKEYVNAQTKLNYTCSKGHRHSTNWNSWQHGSRCPTCYSIRNSGAGNPSWKGGISFEPYCPIWSDKEYKKDIKLRDGNKCLNPDCWKKDSRLHIHHIDYNKKICSPSNVITLCGSCNSRANTNREWHTAWYQALMYMRYKYKY